jgi:SagB-type dehydrogenase family enzyme
MEYGVEAQRRRRAPGRETIVLPEPVATGGMPLFDALKRRHSAREFGDQALSPQMLSNLLWAAFGINRPDSGGRTAPSAHDWEEVDLYVAMASGTYVYDAKAHALVKRLDRDVRESTGLQDFVASASLNLVYIADLSRMAQASAAEKAQYAGPDAGFIAQNVYLYCASEGLATVVRGMIDRPALAKVLDLKPEQQIILAQSVGYPAAR